MKNSLAFADFPHPLQRPCRPWRRWLWRLSSWLKIGGLLATFYIAVETGGLGVLTVAAVLSGVVLRHILESTSCGD